MFYRSIVTHHPSPTLTLPHYDTCPPAAFTVLCCTNTHVRVHTVSHLAGAGGDASFQNLSVLLLHTDLTELPSMRLLYPSVSIVVQARRVETETAGTKGGFDVVSWSFLHGTALQPRTSSRFHSDSRDENPLYSTAEVKHMHHPPPNTRITLTSAIYYTK